MPAHQHRAASSQQSLGSAKGAASAATLLVGLGSPHADDAVGWCVAGAVAAALERHTNLPQRRALTVRQARVPLELLHWCGGASRLVIVDACVPLATDATGSQPLPGTYQAWRWPALPACRLRPATSHDLGLAETLALGSTLGVLPEEITVWGVWIAPERVLPPPGGGNTVTQAPSPNMARVTEAALSGGARFDPAAATRSWASVTATIDGMACAATATGCADADRLRAKLACQLSPPLRAALSALVADVMRDLFEQAAWVGHSPGAPADLPSPDLPS
ncbi:MAG: hypothetical protein K6T86_10585 [Pirellulales bacterium]|nr:hypothetical protein [Pirellulales bacterium]